MTDTLRWRRQTWVAYLSPVGVSQSEGNIVTEYGIIYLSMYHMFILHNWFIWQPVLMQSCLTYGIAGSSAECAPIYVYVP